MVHKNPAQVGRLVRALAHEQSAVYIHLDGKVDARDYEPLAHLPGVHFICGRYAINWASFSFVEATVQGFREILSSEQEFDFINVLSGQDYPLRSAAEIHAFFVQHPGRSFLAYEPVEGSAWWQHALSRLEQYHTIQYRFRLQYRLQNVLNMLLPKRRFPLPYTLYGGPYGGWWTVARVSAAYLVEFMDQHAEVRRFGRLTWGADEFLPATILLNSPLKDTIVNDSLRYVDWSEGGANPKLLGLPDAAALRQSPKLFARKFDITYDEKILDLLDQGLGKG